MSQDAHMEMFKKGINNYLARLFGFESKFEYEEIKEDQNEWRDETA